MTRILTRPLVALASGVVLAGALALQPGTANATPVGSLTVTPSSGSDLTLLTLTTGSECADPSATYISVAISGQGFAVGGTNVVGATEISDLTHSSAGYVIPVSNTLATIASLQSPAATYTGDYTLDVKCRLALNFTSLGDFTAKIHFSDPHTWSVVIGNPPTLITAAHLTGTQRVGFASGCSATISSVTSLKFAWLRNGATIAGATHSTYMATAADYAHDLSCIVYATNSGGTISTRSPYKYVVAGILRNVTKPSLSGGAHPGYTLTCHVGTWSPAPSTYTYTWYTGTSRIAGAARSTFKIPTSYKGHVVSCQVIASRVGYTRVVLRTSAVKVS